MTILLSLAHWAQKWTYKLYERADDAVYALERRQDRYPGKGWMGHE